MDTELQRRNKRLALRITGLVVVLTAGSFGVVPFYRMMCEKFGIGLTPAKQGEAYAAVTHDDRTATVRFMTTVIRGLPVAFELVSPPVLQAQYGKKYRVDYRFTNKWNKPVRFQAVHSLAPDGTDPHFSKLECFCFNQMTLAANESKVLPVEFRIEPTMPDRENITLGYSLFPLPEPK